MQTFTGRAEAKSVSLPRDMWEYLEQRREVTGVPVSVQLRRALLADLEKDGRVLVDPPTPYCTTGRNG